MSTLLTKLAKELLDNQNGITQEAYSILDDMLIQAGEKEFRNTVLDIVEITDGQAYVPEDSLNEFIED